MTPRQQKEARAVILAFLQWDCFSGITRSCVACVHVYPPYKTRLHDRARLFLRQTAPKSPARRKKDA